MRQILACLRLPLAIAAAVSVGVNLLMLASPIFMMQVYDRVIVSGHVETLYALTAIAVIALALLGAFEALRQQLLARAGQWLERTAGEHLIDASLSRRLPAEAVFRHIGAVKRFFCAQGVFTLFDAPWLFVFAGVLWWMHPWLGVVALVGAATLAAIALATEFASRRPLTAAQTHQRETEAILSSALRNADAVAAMGMADALKARWRAASHESQDAQGLAAERQAALSGAAKAVRLIVQTAVLAVGALLVLEKALSPGGMIAASILLSRCLAPVEQGIGAWKTFVLARTGWAELLKLGSVAPSADAITLPTPSGAVTFTNATYQRHPDAPPALADVSLTIKPGEILCVVGPSGGGKTTLARLMVGAIAPTAGEVTLDGRSITGWNRAQLGVHIGYLPQAVELLPGSIADNIRRFGDGADDDRIVAAAQRAGVDAMIRAMPDGYETVIDADGPPPLSGGQLQRVGLARALYGRPRLVVLDEPNANLDAEGDRALLDALRATAADGAAVVVVSHRPALLKAVDRVAIVQDGRLVKLRAASAPTLRPAVISTPGESAPEATASV